MQQLLIAKGLSLPVDAVTQTFAFLARKGAGKTYAAGKLAEELHDAGAQVVILDPIGNWYGLRLAADGKSPGLPIPVFGGEHGDVPLEPGAGALIADVIVNKHSSAVIDVSGFRKGQRKEFVTAFAEQIFHLKKTRRTPVMLMFEEAQIFAPQKPPKGAERMLGAIEDIVRLGRNYGIGSALISQRPQSVNKEVLNQVEALFVMQTTGPHERKAINEWIIEKGIDVKEMVNALPSLPVGTAFLWSPQWLGLLKKIHILPKKTYDASSTPKLGDKRVVPKKLRAVDLAEIKETMAELIKKAKADDPRELKKRIVELEKELKKKSLSVQPNVEIEEVPVLTKENERAIKNTVLGLERHTKVLKEMLAYNIGFEEKLNTFLNALHKSQVIPRNPMKSHEIPEKPIRSSLVIAGNGENIPRCERAILSVLAQYNGGRSRSQVSILSGYSVKSGSFNNSLSALRAKGWLVGGRENMQITKEGISALGSYNPLPTGLDLLQHWLSGHHLGRCEREILKALADAYPGSLTKINTAECSGYSVTSGSFNNALSKLRTLELINGRQDIKASDVFFI